MARKIKHTKNELKAQRDALRRFQRFLPMLQLKKQQLQAEIQSITAKIELALSQDAAQQAALDRWVALFSEDVDLTAYVALQQVRTDTGNIAGVAIPLLSEVLFRKSTPDLFATPPWLDDAQDAMEKLIRLRVEREILEEQRRCVQEELRVTTQRVNLFEKVKIPECRENIRVIRIFLGDEQTAAVARGKITKSRMQTAEAEIG